MIRAFIFLLTIAGPLLTIPPEAPPDPYAVIDQVNRLAAISLWPGFEPQRIPVALFTGTETLLFGHPSPPAEFLPVNDRPGVRIFPGRHESIAANTSVKLGGVLTATIMLDSLRGKPNVEIAGVVIHETYHVFQAVKYSDWSSNEILLFAYPMDEAENESGLLLEARALTYALESRTKVDAARWAACHLKLRGQRYTAFPVAAEYERGVELFEGTAHYVEAKALGKVDDTESLTLSWRPEEVRHRCYFTGKALAGLLDRMNPGWKQGLESGPAKPLDVLLQDSLASEQIEPAQLNEAEVADLRAKAKRAVEELKRYREKTWAEFRERQGPRIIIEAQEGSWMQPRGFDPMNILKVGDKEVLHRRMLTLACKNGNLQVLGLPALTLGLGPHPLFNGIKRVEIAGFTDAPDIKESEGKLTIDSDSLKMDFANATLVRQGWVIQITLH